ncbi:MAG: prepilin-type N-terminal cleavage/methylation domain-containing protein [Candidatus Omnitrophota bacterium]|jgi:prepilin-type N-terminal cleavage/methylation domain-containing protein
MKRKNKAFTLIELIIVVVIIGILALIAIPRYFSNVTKARKNAVYATLDIIKQAVLSYYAVNGVYPAESGWPIRVIVDGDTVINVSNPSDSRWTYYLSLSYTGYCSDATGIVQAQSTNDCWLRMCVPSGQRTESAACTSL